MYDAVWERVALHVASAFVELFADLELFLLLLQHFLRSPLEHFILVIRSSNSVCFQCKKRGAQHSGDPNNTFWKMQVCCQPEPEFAQHQPPSWTPFEEINVSCVNGNPISLSSWEHVLEEQVSENIGGGGCELCVGVQIGAQGCC